MQVNGTNNNDLVFVLYHSCTIFVYHPLIGRNAADVDNHINYILPLQLIEGVS